MMASLSGDVTVHRVPELRRDLEPLLRGTDAVELDLSEVERIDSAGVAMIALLARRLKDQGRTLALRGTPAPVAETLRLFPFVEDEPEPSAASQAGLVERAGKWAGDAAELVVLVVQLFADAAWFLISDLFSRKGLRWGVVAYEMSAMGAKAIGVVGLISFLVGATMALQSATQLRQFGANIFVVDLIGISMTRELGPLMAAIVVAGRSGSSVAAEIGTMVISEEVDALKTMGLHPTRFLVVPKLLAISVTQPLLTVLANQLRHRRGILSGGDLSRGRADNFRGAAADRALRERSRDRADQERHVRPADRHRGRHRRLPNPRGADAVGRSTTTAVVAGIFSVIVADAIASLVFYFGE